VVGDYKGKIYLFNS
jgi:WD40 repeat protein